MERLTALAAQAEAVFYERYPAAQLPDERCAAQYRSYWKKKNALLGCPRDEKTGKQLQRQ